MIDRGSNGVDRCAVFDGRWMLREIRTDVRTPERSWCSLLSIAGRNNRLRLETVPSDGIMQRSNERVPA
jgi:hypothetical protein